MSDDDNFEVPARGAIFWPVGTGDTTTVIVDEDAWLQIDLHDVQAADDDDDPRVPAVDRICELAPERDGNPYIAAFAATHLDKDHICGFEELSERALIGELWFSPRVFWDAVDEDDTLAEDAKVFIAEVDRRIAKIAEQGTVGSGDRILIVGYDDILSEEPYSKLPAECFVKPGEFFGTIDGEDYSEIFRAFVHAPLEGGAANRNDTSLALQITLADEQTTGTVMTFGDLTYPDLKTIFEQAGDDDLLWSVLQAPHHCSKSAVYWKDEGEDEETLKQDILDAIEEAADSRGAWIVASCDVIPASNQPGDNPPHRIAADRYEEIVEAGRFLVTGDNAPAPLVFELGSEGLCLRADGDTKPKGPSPGEAAGLASGSTITGHTSATTFG
jgi:hypothetical protein